MLLLLAFSFAYAASATCGGAAIAANQPCACVFDPNEVSVTGFTGTTNATDNLCLVNGFNCSDATCVPFVFGPSGPSGPFPGCCCLLDACGGCKTENACRAAIDNPCPPFSYYVEVGCPTVGDITSFCLKFTGYEGLLEASVTNGDCSEDTTFDPVLFFDGDVPPLFSTTYQSCRFTTDALGNILSLSLQQSEPNQLNFTLSANPCLNGLVTFTAGLTVTAKKRSTPVIIAQGVVDSVATPSLPPIESPAGNTGVTGATGGVGATGAPGAPGTHVIGAQICSLETTSTSTIGSLTLLPQSCVFDDDVVAPFALGIAEVAGEHVRIDVSVTYSRDDEQSSADLSALRCGPRFTFSIDGHVVLKSAKAAFAASGTVSATVELDIADGVHSFALNIDSINCNAGQQVLSIDASSATVTVIHATTTHQQVQSLF